MLSKISESSVGGGKEPWAQRAMLDRKQRMQKQNSKEKVSIDLFSVLSPFLN